MHITCEKELASGYFCYLLEHGPIDICPDFFSLLIIEILSDPIRIEIREDGSR